MAGEPTCARCGAALAADAQFCAACGRRVAAGSSNALLLVLAGCGLLVGIGLLLAIVLGLWLFVARAKHVQPPTPPAPSPIIQAAPPAAEAEQASGGERFLGTWLAPDSYASSSPASRADITRFGDHLQFMDHGTKAKGGNLPRMELRPEGEDKLRGTYFVDASEQQPVTFELTPGGDKLVMTLSPPASEIVTETWVRAAVESPPPIQPTPRAAQAKAPTNDEQALALVARQPKVKAFEQRLKAAGKSAHIELDHVEDEFYSVHVYEMVEGDGDMPGHTATFGWFNVDRHTGEVREVTP